MSMVQLTGGATNQKPEWYSVDPRNNQQVHYSAADTDKLERSFREGAEEVTLSLGGNPFRIVFRDMLQYNVTGGSRQVVRNSNIPEAPPMPLTSELVAVAQVAVAKMDDYVQHVETKLESDAATRQRGLVHPLNEQEIAAVQSVYHHILSDFQSAKYKTKYNFNASDDAAILSIRTGQTVPSYFANAKGQSIYHRKYLSLLGLRNLVAGGVTVFSQMLAKVFSGDQAQYAGLTGPALMKQMTGSVVDLDSVVLRCSDPQVVSVINGNLKKSPDSDAPAAGFRSGQELADSVYGKKVAFNSSANLIHEFIARFKLAPAEQVQRRVNLPDTFAQMGADAFPVATDNTARSKWPLWLYNNVGVLTFHANVPTMADVYGALLRAPFHFVKAYIIAREKNELDGFFEEALSDSCFNMKWKSIEEYLASQRKVGTIVDALNQLHRSRADIFTSSFYDNDDDKGTNELAVMQRLVAGAKLQGIDETTRKTRLVTTADVKSWHDRLMAVN